MTKCATTSRNVLYRIYDEEGTLLYVGATTNPARRMQDHSQSQPWWDEATEIKMERFETRERLNSAEIAAIAIEAPRYNVLETNKPYLWTRKPRAAKGEGSIFQRSDGYWIARIEVPTSDGRRKRRSVCGTSREVVERKFAQLKAEHGL